MMIEKLGNTILGKRREKEKKRNGRNGNLIVGDIGKEENRYLFRRLYKVKMMNTTFW